MIRRICTGLLLLTLSAGAQQGIQADSESGKPYISHVISSGETLSSLSRIYKLSIVDITDMNHISPDKSLQKGQTIRIPLRATNLSQTACSNCQPVYYKVHPREGLYRIGLNFGNISAATLQKLNNLSGESVDIGQTLIVGYLAVPETKTSVETVKTETVKPKEEVVKTETVKPKEEVVKTEKVPEKKVVENTEKTEPPVVTEKVQPMVVKAYEKPKTTTVEPVLQANNNTDGTGFFSQGYAGKSGVAKSGTAAIFKSTSGWDDTKYYALMNDAQPGSIVKISSVTSGKTIYAKILGELSQIKQNENVLLRISNAGAAALGNSEDNLSVTVNY